MERKTLIFIIVLAIILLLILLCVKIIEQKKNASPTPSITIEPFKMPLPMMNHSLKKIQVPSYTPKAPSS
ncbi:hypothetical protein [Methanocella conradii]|uniref:hypothetical protein n=1 Tax=Methanocella conradii TaxID=1175444 RepID=UPI00157C736D|nr:hypothetical protein [Methanocella conradii]